MGYLTPQDQPLLWFIILLGGTATTGVVLLGVVHRYLANMDTGVRPARYAAPLSSRVIININGDE